MPSPKTPLSTLSPGLPVDAYGAPTVDPTKNVLDHVAAAVRRLDDLGTLRDELVDEKTKHLREVLDLESKHNKEMRESEAKRLDAVHDADQLNARIVADRQSNMQENLARKMVEDREALRSLVESTARTLAVQYDSTRSAMEARVLTLERAFSESKGKEAVVDPQMATLVKLVESLSHTRSVATGERAGLSLSTSILLGAAGLIATILGIVAYLR